jgi:cell wall-associated NlpC family hydrolase
MFGNIKIFPYPFWLIYDPSDYDITGNDILHIMTILKPGDIILRGYKNYLDGKFIPNFPNDVIGTGFSHGAIYVGDNQIVHAVAEGVECINVIDFC